jgi:tRNA A-37 threonylcarbamoyl transferase component Bud32
MTQVWNLLAPRPLEAAKFDSLESALACEGEQINTSDMSTLIRVKVGESHYYVKKYHRGGRYFRRRLGRSRVRAEWENSFYFNRVGVPTARLVGYGERRGLFGDRIGALVIEELENVQDMAKVLKSGHPKLQDKSWLGAVTAKIACYTKRLHEQGFVHGDLKLRNILVDFGADPKVYIIDCPDGSIKKGVLFTRGVVKDLACLDRTAKEYLSRPQRLSFYRCYCDTVNLKAYDKYQIRRILTFFDGR